MARDEIDGAVTRSISWTSDGLLDHIEKTGVWYCPGYGGILLRKLGYSLKVAVKQHVRRVLLEEMGKFQEEHPAQDQAVPEEGHARAGAGRAIFVSNARPGRVYTPPGIRAVCHISGTHDRTVVYGVLGLDGEQLFRQYDKFNGDTFAEYVK